MFVLLVAKCGYYLSAYLPHEDAIVVPKNGNELENINKSVISLQSHSFMFVSTCSGFFVV